MVFKPTINQSQVTLVHPNIPEIFAPKPCTHYPYRFWNREFYELRVGGLNFVHFFYQINFVVMIMVIKVIIASVTSLQNPGNTSQVR